MRCIIEVDSTIDPHDALYRVARVVESGKTSKLKRHGKEIPHYCWATTFKDGVIVQVKPKAHIGAADSFLVTRDLLASEVQK